MLKKISKTFPGFFDILNIQMDRIATTVRSIKLGKEVVYEETRL